MADEITLERGSSLFSAGEVRVAILPVGDVPRHALDTYMACINACRHIALSSMRAHYQEPAQKTPFGNLDWERGYMHLRYLHLDEARKKSRTCDLHRQRSVVAVVGVVHCPWTSSLRAAHTEFTKMCSLLFPEALIRQCLLVDPSEDHFSQNKEHAYEHLVLLQPGGSTQHLAQQFSLCLHDLAALIHAELEHSVLNASPLGMPMGPACYADSLEFTWSTPPYPEGDAAKRFTVDEDEMREKKRWGRLMKAKGDMCLMAGALQDAFDHYRTCCDLSRVSNDLVWYGGAVEGTATARVLQVLAQSTPSPFDQLLGQEHGWWGPGEAAWLSEAGTHAFTHPAIAQALLDAGVEGEVCSLLNDARATYQKKGGVPAASIEVALKLARFVASLKRDGGKVVQKETMDLVEVVLQAVPGLVASVEDRMLALEEAATVLCAVGPSRKRSLLLWYACELGARVSGPRGGGGLAVRTNILRLAAQALTPPSPQLPFSTALNDESLTEHSQDRSQHSQSQSQSQTQSQQSESAANTQQQGDHFSSNDSSHVSHNQSSHWARQGSAAAQQSGSTAPWGYSWACLPLSVRTQYLQAVAPTLLGGVTAARQASTPAAGTAAAHTKQSTGSTNESSDKLDTASPVGHSSTLATDSTHSSNTATNDTITASSNNTTTNASTNNSNSNNNTTNNSDSAAVSGSHLGQQTQQSGTPADTSNHTSKPSTADAANHTASKTSTASTPADANKQVAVEHSILSRVLCGPPMWAGLRLALLESALQAARQTNSVTDVWEVCGAMLRDHSASLPPAQQHSIMEAASQAANAIASGAELAQASDANGAEGEQQHMIRLGPGPLAVLSRIVPPPLGLQPLCFSVAAGVSASKAAGNSPFIFNPNSAKKAEGQAVAAAAAAARLWCAGDTGAVEVWLANPLSVPLRLDRVTLHARLHPIRQDCGQSHQQDQSHKLQPRQQHQSQQPPSEAANATTTSNNDSNKEGDSSAFSNISFSTSHSLWQPHTLEGPVVLPQGGRPTKLQFRGRALAEGRLHLLGVHASAWGVTWLQPFVRAPPANPLQATLRTLKPTPFTPNPAKQNSKQHNSKQHNNSSQNSGSSKGGRTQSRNAEDVSEEQLSVSVVQALPVLSGVLLGPQGLKITPPPEDPPPSAASSLSITSPLPSPSHTPPPKSSPRPPSRSVPPASASTHKPTPIHVWEGQRMQCQLRLTNASAAPACLSVGSARLVVTQAKGSVMKPVPLTRAGHASLMGVSLDIDESVLQAAMPLAAGASVTVPVGVRVGRIPNSAPEHTVEIEVSVLYAPAPHTHTHPSSLSYNTQQPPLPTSSSEPISALHAPPSAPLSSTSSLSAPSLSTSSSFPSTSHTPLHIPPGHAMGRRLVLPLCFCVRPALQITATSFKQQYTPTKDGVRCKHLPLPPQPPSQPKNQHTNPPSSPPQSPQQSMQNSKQTTAPPAQSTPSSQTKAASIAHQLQAALLEPLTAPGERLRAVLGLGSASKKQAAQASSTQQSTPMPNSEDQSGGRKSAGEDSMRESTARVQCENGVHPLKLDSDGPQNLERVVSSLDASALEGCEVISVLESAQSSLLISSDPTHSLSESNQSNSQQVHGSSVTDSSVTSNSVQGSAVNDSTVCNSTVQSSLVQQADAAEGRVLLGLACDSVMQVSVANTSHNHSFQVWLSHKGQSDGVMHSTITSLSTSQPTQDSSAQTTSPPVTLKPGQSTQLFAYMHPSTPHQQQGSFQSAHESQQQQSSSTGHSSIPHPGGGTHSSQALPSDANASQRVWKPAGGDFSAAAHTAADAWVVVWRQVLVQESDDAAIQANDRVKNAGADSFVERAEAPVGVTWLAAADVVKGMSAHAAAVLQPPSLHASLQAVCHTGSDACSEQPCAQGTVPRCHTPTSHCCGIHPKLHDVSVPLSKLGSLPSHTGLGQVWAVGACVGQVMEVRVAIGMSATASITAPSAALATSRTAERVSAAVGSVEATSGDDAAQGTPPPLHVRYSLAITRQAPSVTAVSHLAHTDSGSSAATARKSGNQGSSQPSDANSLIDEGVLVVSGATHDVHAGLLPGRPHQQTLLLAFTRLGLYQVHVTDLAAAPLHLTEGFSSQGNDEQHRGSGMQGVEGEGRMSLAVAASVLRGEQAGGVVASASALVDSLNVLALMPAAAGDSC